MDDLIDILMKLNVGCHIRNNFIAALLYADDMSLISPSLRGLQRMLNACEDFCKKWDICLNPKKSRNMYFGKRQGNRCKLELNGRKIKWTECWNYLGVDFVSGIRFNCCISEKIKRFFRIKGRSNELVMLCLIKTHCIPILTYGIEVIYDADRDKWRWPTTLCFVEFLIIDRGNQSANCNLYSYAQHGKNC